MTRLPSPAHAFSLLEILVVMAILAILFALLVPQVRSLVSKARTAGCAGNLRQTGVVFQNYIADHNGGFRFLRDGSGQPMWFTELRNQAGLSDKDALKVFSCPDAPSPSANYAWYCYGMRLGYLATPITEDPGYPILRDPVTGAGTYGFKLSKVTNLSRFFLMSDSASVGSGQQSFRIADIALYANSGVSMRHQNHANVLFLDGHVESTGASGLRELGFREVLDSENKKTLFAP